MLNARVAVWAVLSATCTVKLDVPAAVGVPEMTPDALNDNPVGRLPKDKLQVQGHMTALAPRVSV
jgi:hypothetical protein